MGYRLRGHFGARNNCQLVPFAAALVTHCSRSTPAGAASKEIVWNVRGWRRLTFAPREIPSLRMSDYGGNHMVWLTRQDKTRSLFIPHTEKETLKKKKTIPLMLGTNHLKVNLARRHCRLIQNIKEVVSCRHRYKTNKEKINTCTDLNHWKIEELKKIWKKRKVSMNWKKPFLTTI